MDNEIAIFVATALRYIIRDGHILKEVIHIIDRALLQRKEAAMQEFRKLLEDEKRQPITYNHYYTDNIQKSREDSTRELIKKSISDADSFEWNRKTHGVDQGRLQTLLQQRIIVNMDDQACSEALICLEAYYKVSSHPIYEETANSKRLQ